MNPPRTVTHIEVDPAERAYSDAQLAADRATARAIAANHPSVYRSGISAQPPSDAMPVGAGSAAAEPAPVFDDFHPTVSHLFAVPSTLPELNSHVSGIGAAARRLAAQVARRDRGQE